jgi:predicted dehydrogenase
MGIARTVGWGLWGSGRISHQVAQDIHLVSGARIVAVGSRRLDAARQFAALHRGATGHDTLAKVISQPGVDALYVATPDGCHRDDVLAALTAGKAVLCEKPLATSLADVQTLVDAATRQRVFLMEAMWTRFLPAVQEIKKRIASDEIGQIRYMHGSFGYGDERRGHAPYAGLAQAMLYDRGIYLVALALLLRPGDPGRASARALEWTQQGVARALCRFELQWDDGTLLEGVCGNGGELDNGFEIVGTRGTISIAAPFFKAHAFSVRPLQQSASTATALARHDRSAASTIAHLKRLKRQFQPLPSALRAVRPAPFNFPGNGYQFEFDEVARCLSAGRLESEHMPWKDSLALARALDLIRRSIDDNAT